MIKLIYKKGMIKMKKLFISLLIGCTILGVGCGEGEVDKAEYDKVIEQNEKLIDTVDRLLEKLDSSEEQLELTSEEKVMEEVKEDEEQPKEEDEEQSKEEDEEQSKEEDAHANEESNSDDTSVWDFLIPFLPVMVLLFMFVLIMCFG